MTMLRWSASCCALAAMMLVPVTRAGAQQDSARTTANTAVLFRPLPVLDYAGKEIPEDQIQMTMRPGRVRKWRVVTGAFLGMLGFAALTISQHDCTIYDPCTAREKYLETFGWGTGIVVGGLVGAATAPAGIDRWRAIQIIRDQRKAESETTP